MENKDSKFRALLAVGQFACRVIDAGEVDSYREIEAGNGNVVECQFDSQAELDAFWQGIEVMDGWLNYLALTEDQFISYHQHAMG